MENRTFHWADYLVFCLSLALTAGIGVFFAVKEACKKTTEGSTENFLMAGRSMSFFPVALSMFASLLNGVFILGGGAEMHYYGTQYAMLPLGVGLAILPVMFLFAPTFHKMQLTSAYEYLEKRFNVVVRILGSLTFILSVVLFLAVVLYVPALAFAQVTGLQFWMTVVITGLTCTLYCGLGGMKAVIWTDTIQVIILIAGLALVAIMGILKVGGGQHAWEVANAQGRIVFDNFDPHPHERHTFWTQSIGQFFTYGCVFMSNQMLIQRYLTVPSTMAINKALISCIVLLVVATALIVLVGVAMTAYYLPCDPLASRSIRKGDQIVALFTMDIIGYLHGLPGLFTAAVFAAALSSVSSAINSLAAVFLEDFIKPAVRSCKGEELSDRAGTWISRGVVVFFGLLTIGLSYSAEYFGPTLITLTPTIWSISNGPLAAIFCLGFFASYANSIGAAVGLISGLALGIWLAVCNVLYVPPKLPLPLGTSQCNFTGLGARPAGPDWPDQTTPIMQFYKISYAWYALLCFSVALIIGLIVSLLTCGVVNSKNVDKSLMFWGCGSCRCYGNDCYRCRTNTDDAGARSYKLKSKMNEMPENKYAYDNPVMDQRF